ncbi:amidase [Dyadobacter sp. NIV53]|uniref:amidase n=1 Tax=Dyadobacter sp. NIV53 TaxID=2861765 RepID=UPI001C86FF57|nr:amidase [Dyadobacter sp. NIV53]
MQNISTQIYSRRKLFSFGFSANALSALSENAQAANPLSSFLVSGDTTDEPIYMSATKLAELIRQKKISSEELVTAYIKRIEHVNFRLNAVVMECFDRALAEAKAADQSLKKGKLLGPLHGVPMTIKDSFETEGVISTGGTLGHMNYIPKNDATVVARLRASGAILLGKTNTPEFTLAGGGLRGVTTTGNIIYGVSKNPYDLNRGTSGSSGGAGSIIAAGGTAFDVGTDWGGSVRLPASTNGITGIKPTSVRIPRTGHIVDYGGIYDLWQQPGPMARRVEDLILLTPILSGPDFKDAAVVPMPWLDPAKVNVAKLKVAFYPNNGLLTTAVETQEAVKQAAKWMEEAGAVVTEDLPKELLDELGAIRRELTQGDSWAFLKRAGDKAGSHVLSATIVDRIDKVKPISAERYTELLEMQDKNRSKMLQWFQKYDVILCPTTDTPAPLIDEGVKDAVPSASAGYVGAYNTTGWPSTVVRCGGTKEGLPIGVQVVAHPWREDISLAAAQYLETRSGGWKKPNI